MFQFHEKAWAALASLRLTVVVIPTLIVCLFVGMFWDQTLTLDEHLATLQPGSLGATLFRFFELNDIFHSWWFSLVVLFLALNLIACSFERLPPIWIDIHNPPWPPTDRDFKTATHKTRFLTTNKAGIIEALKRAFPSPLREQYGADGTASFYAERHKYGRTGVYVIHTTLLMIMFGSIAATNWGIDGMLMIGEGERNHVARIKGPGGVPYLYDLGFDVRCSDFRLKTFVDGSPMAFESDLEVYDPPSSTVPVAKKTIRVNDPLQYEGYTFYQSSYQSLSGEEQVSVGVAKHGQPPARYTLRLGETLTLADASKVVPLEVYQDYAGLGETLRVQLLSKEAATQFLVFRAFPDFDMKVRRGEWDLYFYGAQSHFATGISVGKVPGVSIVFCGFAIMFIGLYMAFGMNHRRYLARIRSLEDGRFEVQLAGVARRHLYAFADEWKKIESQIKEGSP